MRSGSSSSSSRGSSSSSATAAAGGAIYGQVIKPPLASGTGASPTLDPSPTPPLSSSFPETSFPLPPSPLCPFVVSQSRLCQVHCPANAPPLRAPKFTHGGLHASMPSNLYLMPRDLPNATDVLITIKVRTKPFLSEHCFTLENRRFNFVVHNIEFSKNSVQ